MNLRIISLSFLFLTILGGFHADIFAQAKHPIWIDMPYATYSKKEYLVAVGEGKTRLDAENVAFSNLVKVFGTTVEVDARSFTRVDKVNGGTVDEIFQTESRSEREIDVRALHNIENVSIAEFWQDSRTKQWYALAVLPKKKTAQIFAGKINALNVVIQKYLDDAEYEEDLLYKFSLIDMAAVYAQQNENLYKYYNILLPQPVDNMYNYRQIKAKADSVARGITFSINRENYNSLTKFTIEEMVSALGMRMNDLNPTYIFNEKLVYQGTDNSFGIYILNYIFNIELLDTAGNSITTFTFKGKEGGSNEADALRVLGNRLAKDISNKDSGLNANSLLAQFVAFLDNRLK